VGSGELIGGPGYCVTGKPPKLDGVASDDLTYGTHSPEDDRVVELEPEEPPILSDQTVDDTDEGWGEEPGSNDDRLLEDRPPHW
jgi:hypothetical protein